MEEEMNKKYYWLKLSEDFFNQKEIQYIKNQKNSDKMIVIYLKLLLKSLKEVGVIKKSSYYDNFMEELAVLIDENKESVEAVFLLLNKVELISYEENESVNLIKLIDMVGSETSSAKRMRKLRSKSSQSDIEKETEQDKEIEKNIHLEEILTYNWFEESDD